MRLLEIVELEDANPIYVVDINYDHIGEVVHTENLKDVFDVVQSLSVEEENIPEGLKEGLWKHFKPGKTYEVIGIAYREKTGEALVIYKSLYDSEKYPKGTLWGRPIDDFLGTKEVNSVEVPRFEYIGS